MAPQRLSALDASFLAAETPAAHMHVGWAAVFDPPEGQPRPSFEQLRDHIAERLPRAPRYRQRLATTPLGVHDPVWVDDPRFDIDKHVLRSLQPDLPSLVDLAMSCQLERSRPLWEMWVAEELPDGRIGMVGKAHHCMVDGIAAWELASLLLDPEPETPPIPEDTWEPQPAPGWLSRLSNGMVERAKEQLDVLRLPAELAAAPRRRTAQLLGDGRRIALSLGHAVATPAPPSPFNGRSSPLRQLGTVTRPLDDLKAIKTLHGTTVNDVVLAVAAGAVRRYMAHNGQAPIRLKAMVPVSVRSTGTASELGNRISFIFMELPCDEPDPVQRLLEVHSVTSERKRTGEPQGSEKVLKLAGYSPHWLQQALTRVVASPRTFNLVVSNIPGPQLPLYMRGCRVREAYPIVPLAERHALSIGITTIAGQACFGLYADRKSLPDVGLLSRCLDESILELLPSGSGNGDRPRRRHGAVREVAGVA